MSISSINGEQARINRDKTCDKIPLVSTGTNLIDLFQKIHYRNQPAAAPGEVKYSAYIQKKSVGRCILLMIPIIGNIIIAIKDNLHAKKAAEPVKAATKTETIKEEDFPKMDKEIFWDSLEAKGAEKLVIDCIDGKTVTYEKGFFNRLLENKPELADLTDFYTLEFSGGTELKETKAKLLMCGDMFKILNSLAEEHQTHRVQLSKIPEQDFQEVLHAIENEAQDISTYSEDVRLAMNFLGFHPVSLPEGVHGQKDWNGRGVDVGHVPPLPQELLEALNGLCPISPYGSKMIDTHVILWMPPTLNGEPMTVNSLEKMAKADAFGENKIGYEWCYEHIYTDAAINQPLESGYWLALYKKPVAADKVFADQKKYIKDHCSDYEVPKVREVIAASVMQYGCSGDKKERILAREQHVHLSHCEEQVNGFQAVVGALASWGLYVDSDYSVSNYVGICPVRKFF